MAAMKRCKWCNKRVFPDESARYPSNWTWRHYGFAQRECDPPLMYRYAEPKEEK